MQSMPLLGGLGTCPQEIFIISYSEIEFESIFKNIGVVLTLHVYIVILTVFIHQTQLSGDIGVLSKGQCSTPWMAKMADHSGKKEMVHRIQDNIWLYWMLWHTAVSWQGDYWKCWPPYQNHQRHSTLWTRSPYSHFCSSSSVFTEQRSYLSLRMKHPNIKKCVLLSTSKSLAWIFTLASSAVISKCRNKGLTSEWL